MLLKPSWLEKKKVKEKLTCVTAHGMLAHKCVPSDVITKVAPIDDITFKRTATSRHELQNCATYLL